ncbi:HK97-gp10 family putative phage morphogenesis protein [Teredinibacter turnerae]|uniref:HK97-gp10 family putative phage morphogenesis protein n=1 Tax=Teredinibacter turnerae TaxID=2426 RepID=UPI0030CE95A9
MSRKKAQGVVVEGVDDIVKLFNQLIPKDARNLARAVNQGVAAELAKEVRKAAPKRAGVLKKAVAAKRQKSPPDAPVSIVYVRSGKKEKYDGFYWRFVEHGTQNAAAHPFLQPSLDAMRPNLRGIYTEQFVKKLAAMAKRKMKKAGKA